MGSEMCIRDRVASPATRALSGFQDYALLILIVVPFASGFLMMHPTLNPFRYDLVFLVHILSADLLFILIPITKLSHISLFMETQIISEMAWHWPPDAGSKVGRALGKEHMPI